MISFQKQVFKSVFDSANPILFLSKLAGVCPLTKIQFHGKEELYRSRFMSVIQAIILLISLCHLGFIPYALIYIEGMSGISSVTNKTESFSAKVNNQKFITKMANIVLISITAILVRFSNLIQMPKYLPQFLEDLQKMDKIMIQRINKDYKRTIILSSVLIMVSWPYQIYSILVVTTDNWMAFIIFYLNLYNNFSVISCEFQFITFSWFVESRFDKLNKELEKLYEKHYLDNVDASLFKLSISRRCSKLLIEAFIKLNKLYGFQLMVILTGVSLNVLFGFYFSIFGGFTKNSKKTSISFQRISSVTNEILWSFYYLIRFVLVCTVAGKVTDKANLTQKIISNILDKTPSEALRQKLWIYLYFTTTNKLQFTACGFFKINKALITSAVSMGTTYLVILAQFQNK